MSTIGERGIPARLRAGYEPLLESVEVIARLATGVGVLNRDDAFAIRQYGRALRRARFEQLLDARQTGRDVGPRHTAGVERAHRQLRARLADRLRGDDADSLALLDQACRWPGCDRSRRHRRRGLLRTS